MYKYTPATARTTKYPTTFYKTSYLSMSSNIVDIQNEKTAKTAKTTGDIDNFSFKEIILPPWNVSIYTGPELYVSRSVIEGKVFNHEKYEDGKLITTSVIKKIVNGIIYTETGSTYTLRNAEPKYEEYCKEKGVKVFPDNMVL